MTLGFVTVKYLHAVCSTSCQLGVLQHPQHSPRVPFRLWWNLQHQIAPRVLRPLITYVLKAKTEELGAPMAPAVYWVMLMTWLHKGTVCFNYGRVLGSCIQIPFLFLWYSFLFFRTVPSFFHCSSNVGPLISPPLHHEERWTNPLNQMCHLL